MHAKKSICSGSFLFLPVAWSIGVLPSSYLLIQRRQKAFLFSKKTHFFTSLNFYHFVCILRFKFSNYVCNRLLEFTTSSAERNRQKFNLLFMVKALCQNLGVSKHTVSTIVSFSKGSSVIF